MEVGNMVGRYINEERQWSADTTVKGIIFVDISSTMQEVVGSERLGHPTIIKSLEEKLEIWLKGTKTPTPGYILE
jgi:hypothetical protein